MPGGSCRAAPWPHGVVLLGEQPDVVGQAEQPLRRGLASSTAPSARGCPPARTCTAGTRPRPAGRPSTALVVGSACTKPSTVSSRWIAATVPCIRSSSAGRNPTSGIISRRRRGASSRTPGRTSCGRRRSPWRTPRRGSRRAARPAAWVGALEPNSSTADGAVERHPRHDLRVREVLPRTPHLPDPLVGLVPSVLEEVEQRQVRSTAWTSGSAMPAAAGSGAGVEHLAVHVELELLVRGVADAHRRRPLVAGQPGNLVLVSRRSPAGPYMICRSRGLAGDGAQQPVAPRLRLLLVAGVDEREQRERRVAQPAEAVVPVADAADPLGERRRRRGDDPARRRVRERLQRDHRPRAPLGASRRRRCTTRPPAATTTRRRSSAQVGVDRTRQVLVRRVPREDERHPLASADGELGDGRGAPPARVDGVRSTSASGPAIARRAVDGAPTG